MSIPLFAFSEQAAVNAVEHLDIFSTSQTSEFTSETCAVLIAAPYCINNAPFFAWKTSERGYAVAQGNCHSWNCPRCGINRAKQEYARIVEGCRTLAQQHDLYFVTITCRGRDISLEQAEASYGAWTNKLLTALRTRASRDGQAWHYDQVTERQERGHPHSHLITTWKPHDLYPGTRDDWKYINGELAVKKVEAMRSDWFEQRLVSAGLGNQYDVSKANNIEGVSRYVAKYMFKESMFAASFPKGWKRVRYSQSFPELPARETDAILLLTAEDWKLLASTALVVNPRDAVALAECQKRLAGHDVLVKKPS